LLRMFFIFALCVLFDLRDVQQDVENNIYTLPSKVGIANSYRLIYAALSLFVIVSVVQYSRFHLADRLAAALITAIATIAVAIYLRKRPSDKAYAILADGVMLVYALAILI
jgi:1,4-dihydroxy-2-naphthoate octaprenyltransferase